MDQLLSRIEQIIAGSDAALGASAGAYADELLALGERILEHWIAARGVVPTTGSVEGFRLLALHRQGAQGDPSFHACRETCRELVYHCNVLRDVAAGAEAPRRIRLAAMVARHLTLFVAGKLETAGLGEFCCSSRPLHRPDSASALETGEH
jgi:hypothetical protein